jgi:hypothetical protein
MLFSLSFSQQVVDEFVLREAAPVVTSTGSSRLGDPDPVAHSLMVVGLAAGTGAAWAVLSARNIRGGAEESQAQVLETNRAIDRRNGWARWLTGLGGAALITGAALLLWPDGDELEPATGVSASVTPAGGALTFGGRF